MTRSGRWARATFGIGFLVALVLLERPTAGIALFLVTALASLKLGRSPLAALLIGVGVGVFVWLGQAEIRCAADAHCARGTDTTPWFAGAALTTAIGATTLVFGRG